MRRLYGATVHILPIIDHGKRSHTDCIVVHDMENDDLESVENYFKHGATQDNVGAHLGIAGGTIRTPTVRQWADLDSLVYHAIGANSRAVGIELCGFATYTRRQWILRRGQRVALAETIARLCHAYGLGEPHRLKNVFGHVDFPQGGHGDPGHDFPWDLVMKLAVKRYRKWYG